MHYKFTANYEQDNTIVENMNKNVFECHCGFRRYLIKPIFSNDIFTGGDKLKIQKFLEKDKSYQVLSFPTTKNTPKSEQEKYVKEGREALSKQTIIKKWRWRASIPLPLACKANALPSELHPHTISLVYKRYNRG